MTRAKPKTPEENITQSTGVAPENAETPTDRSRSFTCAAAQVRRSADYRSEWVAHPSASFEPVTDICGSVLHPCRGLVRVAEIIQFGKASWYDQVGGQTASGEIFDIVIATRTARSRWPLTRR
jgi:rare lipoprotein A (peptidoglycan hydrolase)